VPGDVGDGGGEVLGVDEGVVVAAGEGEVEQAGGSAVGPVLDVVGVAPVGGSSAVWVGAAFVAGPEGGEQGWGDQAFGASDVEGLAVAAKDDGHDGGVAGELADGFGGEDLAVQGGSGAV
jgi:hypothetical protein